MPGTKILIVDDNKDFATALQERLEGKGYEVITACDGPEGLEKAVAEKPALILLDIKMPQMDGLTFVRRLRKMTPIQKTHVMILTGYETMRDMFALEGIKDYFLKTADMATILATVDQKLRN